VFIVGSDATAISDFLNNLPNIILPSITNTGGAL
jgi:hypothetical protein